MHCDLNFTRYFNVELMALKIFTETGKTTRTASATLPGSSGLVFLRLHILFVRLKAP